MIIFIREFLPYLVLFGQIFGLFLLIVLVAGEKKILRFFSERAILFSFIVALTATLGSLFYSDVLGYEPCKLCWFQRIFMYPQAVLLGLALWKKDTRIMNYAFALSLFGFVIALFHYWIQLTGASILPCSAVGYSASCSQRFVMAFGYITIPLMAATAFGLLLLFFLISATRKKE